MNPDDVLTILNNHNVKITRKTLLNYEPLGLPAPIRGSGGRGSGRFTDYPDNTPSVAFAIYHMLNTCHYNTFTVKEIIEMSRLFESHPFLFMKRFKPNNHELDICDYAEGECNKTTCNQRIEEMNHMMSDYLSNNLYIPLLRMLTYSLIMTKMSDYTKPINITWVGGICYGLELIEINNEYVFRWDDKKNSFISEPHESNLSKVYEINKINGIARHVFIERLTGEITTWEFSTGFQ